MVESLNIKEIFEQLDQLVEQRDAVGLEKVVNEFLSHLQTQLSCEQFFDKERPIRYRLERMKKLIKNNAPAIILESELKILKKKIQ